MAFDIFINFYLFICKTSVKEKFLQSSQDVYGGTCLFLHNQSVGKHKYMGEKKIQAEEFEELL